MNSSDCQAREGPHLWFSFFRDVFIYSKSKVRETEEEIFCPLAHSPNDKIQDLARLKLGSDLSVGYVLSGTLMLSCYQQRKKKTDNDKE